MPIVMTLFLCRHSTTTTTTTTTITTITTTSTADRLMPSTSDSSIAVYNVIFTKPRTTVYVKMTLCTDSRGIIKCLQGHDTSLAELF